MEDLDERMDVVLVRSATSFKSKSPNMWGNLGLESVPKKGSYQIHMKYLERVKERLRDNATYKV